MIARFFSVVTETFILLRRDRIFFPVVLAMMCVTGLANLASYWGTEEYSKILYDIGLSGTDLVGSFIAIFWGTKIIADTKRSGTIEYQMAAPIGRQTWIFARYLGLSITLVFLSILMIVIWQIFLLLNNFGWMSAKDLVLFLVPVLGWLVIAAVAVFFGTLGGFVSALFCTAGVWILGLSSANIAATLNPDTPKPIATLAKWLAKYWNLQEFNLGPYASVPGLPPPPDLLKAALYALALIVVFVVASQRTMQTKDVYSDS